MENTAVAHIITPQARALGEPGIAIMSDAVDLVPELIEEYFGVLSLETAGWRAIAAPEEVETGYWVVKVERI